MTEAGRFNSFVATEEEMLRFLESYREGLFYFDINPSDPPQGSRHFNITTFAPEIATRVIDELHPGPNPPRLTPNAREKIRNSSAPPPIDPTLFKCGMNIHPKHGHGWPTVDPNLSKTAWVRFPFTSSPAHFPNLNAAFSFFDPVIERYNQMGVGVMLVLTHEMYGEAAGYVWSQMDAGRWASFREEWLKVAEQVIKRYGDKVGAYQIWNEGDAEIGNPAAVHFPPRDYAPLLDASAQLIRQNAPKAKVISGGLMRGPHIAGVYLTQIREALKGRLPVDGIGYHPYGKGAPNDKTVFSRFGNIKDDIEALQKLAPAVPIWFTEVGAMGVDSPDFWDDVALYMQNLFHYLRAEQGDKAPVAIWYAWSDAMDVAQKTNGLVTLDGKPKPFVYDTFFREACR